MKVLVCGAGQVGFNIARHLAGEGIDITVIDHDADRIRKVSDGLDVQALHGFASHPDVLKQAGAGDADMIIAVTLSDEINMISCQVAHTLFNVPTKIARVRHNAYLDPAWAAMFSRDHIPIDFLISPEAEVVSAIDRRLAVPGAVDMMGFADDRIRLVGVRLTDDCPVVNTPLRQLTELFPDLDITVVYIIRADKGLVPHGMDQMLPDDEVYFLARTEHVPRAMAVFGHEEEEAHRLVIIGGGNIGLELARRLEQSDATFNIKLIEFDKSRAEAVAEQLNHTMVLNGDALDTELLDEASIDTAETVVAVTDDDEVNILASVLAKRHGCARAITLINATTFTPLISPLGIDASVSPREITVSSILEHIRRGSIRAVYTVHDGEAEVIEAEALESAPVAGNAIKDAGLPTNVLVGAILRDDEVIIPRANTVIKAKDRVVVFVPHDLVKKVEQQFSVAIGFF